MSEWVGDGEPVDVYREKRVRARKEHRCGACAEPITPGHVYVDVVLIADREVHDQLKRCLRCQTMHEHLRSLAPQDEWPREDLGCGHSYQDVHGVAPPDAIAALAFMTAEEAQRELVR